MESDDDFKKRVRFTDGMTIGSLLHYSRDSGVSVEEYTSVVGEIRDIALKRDFTDMDVVFVLTGMIQLIIAQNMDVNEVKNPGFFTRFHIWTSGFCWVTPTGHVFQDEKPEGAFIRLDIPVWAFFPFVFGGKMKHSYINWLESEKSNDSGGGGR